MASFDAALSLVVLHFVPEYQSAVSQMVRVTKPGGTVAATVWDRHGGLMVLHLFWDTAAVFDRRGAAPGKPHGRA